MKKSKLALFFALGGSTLALTSCDVPISQESFIDKLFPDPYDALVVFVSFIVLLVVVFFVAYKPVKKLIQKRKDYVEGKINNAIEKEKTADEKLEKANEEVKNKKAEAIALIEDAKVQAGKEKQAILDEAKRKKELEVKKAKEEIAQEIEASKDELHREIVSVAIDASSKVLEREVNSKDNEKLIDNFIDDLKEGK